MRRSCSAIRSIAEGVCSPAGGCPPSGRRPASGLGLGVGSLAATGDDSDPCCGVGTACGDGSLGRGESASSGNCFTGSDAGLPSASPMGLATCCGVADPDDDDGTGLDDAGASVPFCRRGAAAGAAGSRRCRRISLVGLCLARWRLGSRLRRLRRPGARSRLLIRPPLTLLSIRLRAGVIASFRTLGGSFTLPPFAARRRGLRGARRFRPRCSLRLCGCGRLRRLRPSGGHGLTHLLGRLLRQLAERLDRRLRTFGFARRRRGGVRPRCWLGRRLRCLFSCLVCPLRLGGGDIGL
jgi:hypothetical protein